MFISATFVYTVEFCEAHELSYVRVLLECYFVCFPIPVIIWLEQCQAFVGGNNLNVTRNNQDWGKMSWRTEKTAIFTVLKSCFVGPTQLLYVYL